VSVDDYCVEALANHLAILCGFARCLSSVYMKMDTIYILWYNIMEVRKLAYTSELLKSSVSMKLNNGTTASGATKLVTASFPKIDGTAYTDAKAGAIKDAVAPCLALEVEDLQHTIVNSVYDAG